MIAITYPVPLDTRKAAVVATRQISVLPARGSWTENMLTNARLRRENYITDADDINSIERKLINRGMTAVFRHKMKYELRNATHHGMCQHWIYWEAVQNAHYPPEE